MRVPLRIRVLEDPAQPAEFVDSMNISLRGAYFPTSLPLKVGSYVEVRFKMPEEILPGQTHEWTFTAKVAHCQPLPRFGKKFGVGVYFLYYSAA
ncbi:MAG: hypothetical protein NVS9B14_04610 [Candidatus Acidiferrum sp.]